jgi:hypothetical protein
MSDRDRSTGEEMVSELGIDPSVDIDSDQRAELLERWHEEDAENDEEARKEREAQKRKP